MKYKGIFYGDAPPRVAKRSRNQPLPQAFVNVQLEVEVAFQPALLKSGLMSRASSNG
jgi:hypothetical protein